MEMNGLARMPMTTLDRSKNTPFCIVPCGRLGCVAVYSSRDCHMCDMMEEIVKQAVIAEGLSEDIVNCVSEEIPVDRFHFDSVYGIPSVRVCDMVLSGIPAEKEIRYALRQANYLSCLLKNKK